MQVQGLEGSQRGSTFDENRFIGIAGREAFHVFDLEKMDFVLADKANGYY